MFSMRAVRLFVCLIIPFLMAGVPAQSQTEAGPPASRKDDNKKATDTFTPVIASPLLPTTFAVEGTDNKRHIVYELVITNTGTMPATLQKIEVVSPDASHQVLASFEGEALLTRLRTAGH